MSYIKGRAAEYRIIKILKDFGYSHIVRSAGSKGIIDLIAINPKAKKILAIQVKKSNHKLNINNLKNKYGNMKELKNNYELIPMLALIHKRKLKFIEL